jgi:branched-subunit amino acid ABC-type transport system permease component
LRWRSPFLDVVNIAHPALILLGSYVAFTGNTV